MRVTSQGRTVRELASRTGIDEARLERLLEESEREGVVQHVGADAWRLHPGLPRELRASLRVLVEAGP